MRLLYVHKFNPQDPTDQALRKWVLRDIQGSEVFCFTPDERNRTSDAKATPLKRLLEAVERQGTTHVFSWVPYLNLAEVKWLKDRGVVVASAQSGVSTLSHGFIPDQAEYLEYLGAHSYFFIPHAPHVPVLRSAGVNAVELPFCYDDEIYKPLPVRAGLRTLAPYRGSYIGNFGGTEVAQGRYRASIVKEVAKAFRLLLVCDPRYRDYGFDRTRIFRSPTVTRPALLNFLLNTSSFSIGTDAFPEIEDYYRPQYKNVKIPYDRDRDAFVMRPRTFWSMGTGVPFAVENYSEIRRFFEPGKEIILWENPADVVDQIIQLGRNPGELQAMGDRGWKKIRRLHSARLRVSQLKDMLMGGNVPNFTSGEKA